MAFSKPVLAAIFLFLFLDKHAESAETSSSNSNDDTSSIPMIASGKRQHNIMRFGKRPAGGHNLIHFGKKDDSRPPQHSFLYFGKRMNEQASLPDILQYLQKTNDKSYKRGHTIMRFGKRSPNPNFMTLARDDGEDYFDEYYPDEGDVDEMKRDGHNMMYFGKRGGHSMLYFGKRGGGHNMLSFGKRDDDKRAHSMIHFGKREDDDDGDDLPFEEKRAHSMIHFGKRESDDYDVPDMDIKRAAHSMIHFGKREFHPDVLPYWNPNTYEKEQQKKWLRFGKKMDGLRRGSHAMIHFGKRDDDKRAHSMIHFGKRSVDQTLDSATNNQSGNGPNQPGPRVKRDLEESAGSSEPLLVYGNHEDEDMSPDEELENEIKASNLYHASDIMDHLAYPDEDQPLLPFYPEYRPVHKKEASKNVFLRFG